MKKLLLVILLIACQFGFSQSKETVKGLISDKENNGAPLPFANVFIKGTTIGTTTDIDGKYTLSVPVGKQILVVSFVGYKTVEKPITVTKGKRLVLNVSIGANQGVSLDEVKIKGNLSREKESALLLEQKKAVAIKTTIGAQELSKKGIGNVAVAVTKTTGVSKQEGSNNIYVRGLGDRYNSTTFNGLPLPSNNPSMKNISLDIFSTGIVQAIDINKTYNSTIYGDFGGANINIVSKEHHGKPYLDVSLGSGINSNAIGQKKFYLQDGPNFSGFYSSSFPSNPFNNSFTTSWDRKSKTPIDGSIAIKGGKNFRLGESGKLSVFGTASFSNDFKFKEGISRGQVTVQRVIRRDLNFKSYNYKTNATGMLNLSYRLDNKNIFKFNSLLINSSNQSLEDYDGTIDSNDNASNGGGFIRRSTFDRTTLFVNQLLGKNKISEKINLKWGIALNKVKNIIPDRRQFVLVPMDDDNPQGVKKVADFNVGDNNRFYQNLKELEYAANYSANYLFDKDDLDYKGKISLGVSVRHKKSDFDATQFNFRIDKNNLFTSPIDINNLDGFFNQSIMNGRYFSIITFRGNKENSKALLPQIYKGRQTILGSFVQAQYKLSKKITAVVGLRFENISQNIEWETQLNPDGGADKLTKNEILPNISLKYALNDNQNLKFAASKSYTLPQFKERAPFQFSEVTQDKRGNERLRTSTNYNADLRWEWFPKSSEVVSLTGFGKIIKNPINELVIASASNDISYANSGKKATVFGAELEVRKQLFNHITKSGDIDLSNKLTAGFNASYMHTNQDFDNEKITRETNISVNFTNLKGRISGASDLLLNADISYLKEFNPDQNILATLTFAYFSDRIYAINSAKRGDLIDQPVATLDFILKSKLNKKIDLSLAIKNILNPTVKRIQEVQNVPVLSFKKGINAGLSLNYKLD